MLRFLKLIHSILKILLYGLSSRPRRGKKKDERWRFSFITCRFYLLFEWMQLIYSAIFHDTWQAFLQSTIPQHNYTKKPHIRTMENGSVNCSSMYPEYLGCVITSIHNNLHCVQIIFKITGLITPIYFIIDFIFIIGSIPLYDLSELFNQSFFVSYTISVIVRTTMRTHLQQTWLIVCVSSGDLVASRAISADTTCINANKWRKSDIKTMNV